MSIHIKHRFSERLNSTEGIDKLNVIIIGTFNPGPPDENILSEKEKEEFELIKISKKFIRFSNVKNFYDRPQNRFWKVMDYINDREFYTSKPIRTINFNGLKYYYKIKDREAVFRRQKEFCIAKGILITDIVSTIEPSTFNNIYDNFPDSVIEKSKPTWNTEKIKQIIRNKNPEKVLINFKFEGNGTPNVKKQIREIINEFPDKIVTSLKSTSGAAGNNYEDLIKNWKEHFV